jgi:Dolichyl-phosphate-mannose-protein mannosyltransferase
MKRSTLLLLVLLGAVLWVADLVKPLTVDDAVYCEYARHIAAHPTDPYGFALGPGQCSANHILAPAGFLYWWGAVYALVGDWPIGWKIGMAPVCFLFIISLGDLLHRFAPGREGMLAAMVVLSPAVLPGVNLMLDVPALTLELLAVAVFLRACDNGRISLTLLAGLLAGLAMQTKYTAFVTPALLVGAGLLYRRPRHGALAAALAILIFVGWEAFLIARYHESHFLVALDQRKSPLTDKLKLFAPLVGLLGGTASAVALVSLAGLKGSRFMGWMLTLTVLAGYLLIACVPESHAILVRSGTAGRSILEVNSLVFGTLGLAVLGLSMAGAWALLRDTPDKRAAALLVGWLMLELVGYVVLSPYPAVRRVLGLVVIGTLMTGSLAVRQERTRRQDALFRLAVVVSIGTGFVSFLADFTHYRVEQRAAEQAVALALDRADEAVVWVQGVDSFDFYARRRGARWIDPEQRDVQPGDWFLMRQPRPGAPISSPGPGWEERGRFDLGSRLPFRSCYQWGGATLAHSEGPILEVALYRRSTTTARSP